jgi:hypothetical protein
VLSGMESCSCSMGTGGCLKSGGKGLGMLKQNT